MPHRIAEQLRKLAVQCQVLADRSSDKDVSNELEGVAAELAEKAKKLEDLFVIIEST
jgi:hypothetical protein